MFIEYQARAVGNSSGSAVGIVYVVKHTKFNRLSWTVVSKPREDAISVIKVARLLQPSSAWLWSTDWKLGANYASLIYKTMKYFMYSNQNNLHSFMKFVVYFAIKRKCSDWALFFRQLSVLYIYSNIKPL